MNIHDYILMFTSTEDNRIVGEYPCRIVKRAKFTFLDHEFNDAYLASLTRPVYLDDKNSTPLVHMLVQPRYVGSSIASNSEWPLIVKASFIKPGVDAHTIDSINENDLVETLIGELSPKPGNCAPSPPSGIHS